MQDLYQQVPYLLSEQDIKRSNVNDEVLWQYKGMRSELFLILCMLGQIKSNEQSNFLIDYFVFKRVSYVVGFFCCNMEVKLMVSKKLNNLGIRTSLPDINSHSQISSLIGSKYKKIGVFVDISCYDEDTLYSLTSKANDWRLYDEMHNWLIFADGNFSKAVGQLDELNGLGMSTDLVIAVPNVNGYELFDVYNPWKEGGTKINITRFGTWNHSSSLHVTLTQSKFRRRCNLYGLKMKSNFFRSNYRPKNMSVEDYMRNDSFGYKDGLSRFGYNLVTHLSEMYNFTLQFGEIKKWLHGDTLGPMSRALIQNEIQITGSPVIITEERLRLTKFVYPAWPFRTCFMFRNPQKQDIKIGEVLHPFADESWFATLVALIGISAILALSLKQESYIISEDVWSNSFLITIGSMCQQATHFNLERITTRIVVVILVIFSYLIYTYYNVTIMSTRLNEPILKINDSLNELGKLGYKMASEPMNYFEFIFTQLTEWERKVFYDSTWLKIPESERFMFPEQAVPLVRKGGFAYHTHPDVSYPIIDKTFSLREICELMEVHPVPLKYSTLSVSYNSTFVELAKVGLSRMTEVGLRHRQIRRWTSRKPLCHRDEVNVTSTDIYGFAPHLMLLAIGIIITAVIFIIEFIITRANKAGSISGYYPRLLSMYLFG